MNAVILTVGDEILIGQVVDTNSAWLGGVLNSEGIVITEILSVGDDINAIIDGLTFALEKADLVIMTGGLGPTIDDITKSAIASFFNVDMVFSEKTYERIVRIFEKYGRTLSESHKDQCYMPQNATLLHNKMGTAPGMLFEYNNKILVSLPGVPFEMKSIVTDELLPLLRSKPSKLSIKHRTIMTMGEGETTIADMVAQVVQEMPPYIKLAYLPSLGSVRLRLTGQSDNALLLDKEIEKFTSAIVQSLGSLVYGYDDISIEEYLLNLFKSKNLTIGTAESCTGGYIAHKITSVPGSSAYFIGSVVAYTNELKTKLLGVQKSTIDVHGAVSEDTVKEMVQGLLKLIDVEIGIAISGIAGPDGGTIEKPVGTIWMAVGNAKKIDCIKITASKDRLKNIEYSANFALNRVRHFVLDNY